ncbi:HSP20-like chaperone [Lipomyces japonicus]|uniref:HSP20-like chaperone n=1 Tax=Lipomyces japonicus TaxID=56871 RepID=UPI0034CDE901
MSSHSDNEPSKQELAAAKAKQDAEQAALPYKWSQVLEEVTVTVPVPKGTRGRDLTVQLGTTHLKVGLKGQPDFIIDDFFYKPIKPDESTWTVDDQQEVTITIAKQNGAEWWPHVVAGAPKIDVSQIQPENSRLSDLDGETRGMVEKMMFDQQQKQLGKPTSDELKKQQAFENFKKQHPEMDFSQVKLN